MNPLREAAIEYAIRGWKVFPLQPRSKYPNGFLVPQGYQEASSWAPDCLYWWEREPEGNIGLACRDSGLLVLDVDPRNGGDDSLAEAERKYGFLPRTLTAETPTGGEHIFFKHPRVDFKKELCPGVDLKDRGYVLLAPSVREMGEYAWDQDGEPPDLPRKWLEAAVGALQRKDRAPLAPSDAPLLQIPAESYASLLTGREVVNGWMQCPFHRDGQERTPSFKVDGPMWACFACEPLMGKQVMGGNLLDLAGMLKGYAMPLRGVDLQEVKAEMERMFCATV